MHDSVILWFSLKAYFDKSDGKTIVASPLGHDNGQGLRPNFAEAALKITNIQPQSRQSTVVAVEAWFTVG